MGLRLFVPVASAWSMSTDVWCPHPPFLPQRHPHNAQKTQEDSVRIELNCRIPSWCPKNCLLVWGKSTNRNGVQDSKDPLPKSLHWRYTHSAAIRWPVEVVSLGPSLGSRCRHHGKWQLLQRTQSKARWDMPEFHLWVPWLLDWSPHLSSLQLSAGYLLGLLGIMRVPLG